jgi:hypothetical protein
LDEASQPIDDATRVFEQKGNLVWARRARELKHELVRS